MHAGCWNISLTCASGSDWYRWRSWRRRLGDIERLHVFALAILLAGAFVGSEARGRSAEFPTMLALEAHSIRRRRRSVGGERISTDT